MTVVQTSLDSYAHLYSSNRLSKQQQQLKNLFKNRGHPIADFEIEGFLGWRPNVSSARRNELMKAGFIFFCGHKFNPKTKMKVRCYSLK